MKIRYVKAKREMSEEEEARMMKEVEYDPKTAFGNDRLKANIEKFKNKVKKEKKNNRKKL